MKIALYVPSWPPGFSANGIVTYASWLVPALRRLNHEVFVLTFDKAASHDDDQTIDLRSYAATPNFLHKAMFKLIPEAAVFNTASSAIVAAIRELVDRHNLDVFEIEESFGWSFAISRLKLLPVVVRVNGPWFLNGRFNDPDDKITWNRHREEWERRGIQDAQYVTAPSAEVLQAVRDHYGLRLTESRVIPSPLDAADKAEIWDVKTCNKDSLLFVGRFDRRKGGDLVLRAFAELALLYPRLKLTFVGPGGGVYGDDNKVWPFERFVRSNFTESCWSRIEYRGYMEHHSDIMSLRPKHFATIVASQYETFCYAVLEAMSLGCPLVATAVGGIPELIRDQQNGLLVPSQDLKAMAVACRKLLDDHILAERLGGQAWRDCRDFYGSENIAKQTIAAYKEAIDRFKSRRWKARLGRQ